MALESDTLNSSEIFSSERLIKKGSYLDRLLSKEHLGFFSRFFVKETAYTLYKRLVTGNQSRLEEYQLCFEKRNHPNTPGWKIMKEVYEHKQWA
jgi:hypothetical protein